MTEAGFFLVSYYRDFEFYIDDVQEKLKSDISACWKTDASGNPTEPNTSQAVIAEMLLAKKKVTVFFMPLTPLCSMQSLLPPELVIGGGIT